MAEKEVEQTQDVEEEPEEEDTGYKPPAYEKIDDILQKDAEDESLRKYKEALLGSQIGKKKFPDDPRIVIIKSFSICAPEIGEKTISFEGKEKEQIDAELMAGITIKEGASFDIKIEFYVNQKEIVSGLKYTQKVFKSLVKVDTHNYMLGSYGPSEDAHIFKTKEEAPKGMLARGSYTLKCRLVDDDKNEHTKFNWVMKISKEWK